MALRLLWYAGPDGRAEALLDMENELRGVAAERDAVVAELQRRRGLIDERSASLAAKVRALEHENCDLRRLLSAAELAAELAAVRSSMDRLLRKVAGTRVVEVP
jgi:ABC-type transporter Mla subunit MlaD